MFGANTDELRRIAGVFDTRAGEVTGTRGTCDREVEGVEWVGPDADRFRDDWRLAPSTELDRLDDLLRDLAQVLRRQADEQDAASAGGAGGAPGGGGPQAPDEDPVAGWGALAVLLPFFHSPQRAAYVVPFVQMLLDRGGKLTYGRGDWRGWDWSVFSAVSASWGANGYIGSEHYPGNMTEGKYAKTRGGAWKGDSKHKLDEARSVLRIGAGGELLLLAANAHRSVDVPGVGPVDVDITPYAGARGNIDLLELKYKHDLGAPGIGPSTFGAKIGAGGFVGAELPISASKTFGDGLVTLHGTAAGRFGASAEAGGFGEYKQGVISFGGKAGAGLGFGGGLRGGVAIDLSKAPGIRNFLPGI